MFIHLHLHINCYCLLHYYHKNDIKRYTILLMHLLLIYYKPLVYRLIFTQRFHLSLYHFQLIINWQILRRLDVL